MTTTVETIDAVRGYYAGLPDRLQAGAELLIRDGKAIYRGAPWLRTEVEGMSIDTDALTVASAPWSSGEKALTRIAVGLIDCGDLDSADIARLDRRQLRLVLAAVAHAAGSHHDVEVVEQPNGAMTLAEAPSLMDWPEVWQ